MRGLPFVFGFLALANLLAAVLDASSRTGFVLLTIAFVGAASYTVWESSRR